MGAASFDALGTDRVLGSAVYRDEDFPGCESFHLPAGEIGRYEGRLEFWDGVTETAWKVCEPTSIQHEEPSRLLGQMAGRFAMMRGSRIASFGSADLVRRDAVGRKRWLMQADEVLYLHPDRVRLQGPAIDVDADPLPDVVLEVDHTTDVRRRKLGIYKESGFAEIWVLVPWEASVRAPGLTILVRWGAEYREEGESRVFPGWKAQEIHLALTEAPMSEPAWRALGRTALAMGAREGTTPQHDPLMASESARVQARSRAQAHMEAVAATLRARGIEVSSPILDDRKRFAGLPIDRLMAAALACVDEVDFRRRIRERLNRTETWRRGGTARTDSALTRHTVSLPWRRSAAAPPPACTGEADFQRRVRLSP